MVAIARNLDRQASYLLARLCFAGPEELPGPDNGQVDLLVRKGLAELSRDGRRLAATGEGRDYNRSGRR